MHKLEFMKSYYPFLITLIVSFAACKGVEKIDSDFKINPLIDPESTLKSFFLTGDTSVILEVSQKPETDVPAGMKYGITLVPEDSVGVKYSAFSTVKIALDSATPATAKIKNIYITSSASEGSYWNCKPQSGALEVRSFTFTISNTVKSGRFPIKIWARLQDSSKDSNNVTNVFYVTVPQKVLPVSLNP